MLEERFWKRIRLGFVSMNTADLTQAMEPSFLCAHVLRMLRAHCVSIVDVFSVVGLCLVQPD